MYMGDYIEIDRNIGPFEFECSSVSTGTPFSAKVDEDKRELFLDTKWIQEHPSACRFLRPSGKRVVCTIHNTSAAQCRSYRCVVLRVYSSDRKFLGTVTGTLALHNGDVGLQSIWERGDRIIPWDSRDVEDRIAAYLIENGYIDE
jgi:Fe-S-cluster containining protein